MKQADGSSSAGKRIAIFILLSLIIVLQMWLLNLHTPLQNDDYDYSISWATGQPVSGLQDVFASQRAHYRLWGGRSITHTLVQLFLYLGKPAFNIANALMYLGMLYVILYLSGESGRNYPWEKLLLAHMAIFWSVPFFGVVFLWLDGACNYLWGTVLALLPLVIEKSRRQSGFFANGWTYPLALVLSFLAGWSNENTACGVFLTLIIMDCTGLGQNDAGRKGYRDGKTIILRIVQLTGILIMLLAPGNFARASTHSEALSIRDRLIQTFKVGVYFVYYTWPLLLLLLLNIIKERKRISLQEILSPLLLASVFSAAALAFSPEVSDRSFTACIVLLLADLLSRWERSPVLNRRTAYGMLTCLTIILAFTGVLAQRDVEKHERLWTEQLEQIEAAKAADKSEVTLSSVPGSRYTMAILLAEQPDTWPNTTLGKWYGIQIYGNAEADSEEPLLECPAEKAGN